MSAPLSRRALLGGLLVAASGCGGSVPPASAAQRARVGVVLYTSPWCPVCARARGWLHARNIPFVERDVEQDPAAAAALRRISGARVVPVLDVEGEVFEGFDAEDVRRAIDRRAHER
jgi:glutaredoxin